LGDKDLEGATLYVTLEPCIVRQAPKKPCAEWIVAARIKKVWIGMLDPNPEIQGRGLTHLQRNGVEVDFFDLDLWGQIRDENKGFVQQYEQAEEVAGLTQLSYEGPSEKEKEPMRTASLDEFSPHVIKKHLAARGKKFRVPSSELWTFFLKSGFVTEGKNSGSYVPTIGGLLLFGSSPEDFLTQCKIKAEAEIGDRVVTEDIVGPLLLLPDKVKDFLSKQMRSYTEIREFKRIKVPEYPWDALREAVVNAIVHRDYKEGARVLIQLLDDRLVIKSPGLPLRPLSLAKIRAYNAPPYSRNPRIADAFCQMDLMEERGWGLPRMRDEMVKHGLPPPRFDVDSGYFVVTFYARKREPGAVQVAPELLAQLEERQKKMLDLVRKERRLTRSECMAKLNISRNTATRDLNKLVELGLLEKKGKGPSTYYILIGS
jgi:ATP-dependent DNA helicase RecG